MATAQLEDSRGINSCVIDARGERVSVAVSWIAQPFSAGSPEAREARRLTLRWELWQEPGALRALYDQLTGFLRRPLSELVDEVFVADQLIADGEGSVRLQFGPLPMHRLSTTISGGGLAVVRFEAAVDVVAIGLPIDITVLDRFCSQLGDLLSAD